jgi:ribosome modulation factor
MTDSDAFEMGYDAYWDGVDVADNPFQQEEAAESHASWNEGWHEARQHDFDESEGPRRPE